MQIEITASELSDLVEAAQNVLSDSVSVRMNYSGRSMYGRTCIGFVGGRGLEFALGAAVAQVMPDRVWEFSLPSTDSMGYDQIVYFTGLSLAEGEEYAGDDEE